MSSVKTLINIWTFPTCFINFLWSHISFISKQLYVMPWTHIGSFIVFFPARLSRTAPHSHARFCLVRTESMAAEVQRTAIFKSIINLHPFKAERERVSDCLILNSFSAQNLFEDSFVGYDHKLWPLYARTLLFWNIYKLPVFFYCVSW